MLIFYLIIFTSSFALSLLSAIAIRRIALRLQIVDQPDKERRFHAKSTPLLGGTAIFFAFFVMLYIFQARLLAGDLKSSHWLGFFLGGVCLMIGGYLDDKHRLRPGFQLFFPLLAALLALAGGIGIEKITNPLGGFLYLEAFRIPLFSLGGIMHYFVLVSDLIVFAWLMGMMYTTKLLDGVDGLVSGLSGIGALIIFLFTQSERYFQPDIGLAALILAGACFGFLFLNWHPAKIFLGEGGSLFLGYALGVLAVISGGKIAIALLVMAIPIMDLFWTIIRRLREGKNPFRVSDRKHLHFRLQAVGLSPRQTVLFYYSLAVFFGLGALFLQSRGKMLALAVLIAIMLGIIIIFNRNDKKLPL